MARSRDFTTSLRTGWVFIRDIGFAACLTALQVYGEVHTGDFIGSSTLDPTNPYSASKGAAEMFVKAYMKSHKLPAVIIRLKMSWVCIRYDPVNATAQQTSQLTRIQYPESAC